MGTFIRAILPLLPATIWSILPIGMSPLVLGEMMVPLPSQGGARSDMVGVSTIARECDLLPLPPLVILPQPRRGQETVLLT
jgi:hypothetical protein